MILFMLLSIGPLVKKIYLHLEVSALCLAIFKWSCFRVYSFLIGWKTRPFVVSANQAMNRNQSCFASRDLSRARCWLHCLCLFFIVLNLLPSDWLDSPVFNTSQWLEERSNMPEIRYFSILCRWTMYFTEKYINGNLLKSYPLMF